MGELDSSKEEYEWQAEGLKEELQLLQEKKITLEVQYLKCTMDDAVHMHFVYMYSVHIG